MEKLTARQSQLGADIQKLITNFRKDSAVRKTTEEYFTTRRENLEALWKRFDETDSEIRAIPELNVDDEYFTSSYYDGVKQLYNQFKNTLRQGRDALLGDNQASEGNKPDPSSTPGPSSQGNPHATTSTPVPSARPHKDSIQGLIRRQGALKTSLKRLLNSSSIEEAPAQSLTVIERLWQTIEEIHLNIWEKCDNPDAEGYDDEDYLSLEENVIKQLASISKKQPSQAVTSGTPTSNQLNTHMPANLQLPKISIPRFDGDYLK